MHIVITINAEMVYTATVVQPINSRETNFLVSTLYVYKW